MNKKLVGLFIFTAVIMMQGQAGTAAPLYQVSVVQNAAKAINYRNLKGSAEIDFKGTVLLTDAKGTAVVRNKSGVMEIKAKFENLSAPVQFGDEYMTYILWAISPDGKAMNLGELIVKNGKSRIETKAPMQAMSLIVTAEPYFAVSQPGNVVVLENAVKAGSKAKIELIDAKYELLPRGEYTKNLAAADRKSQVMDKKTPFYVYQARNAVWIAKLSGAETYASDGFKNAQRLLALAETKEGGKKSRELTAREAIQGAEGSRSVAMKQRADEAILNEKKQAQNQINDAQKQAIVASAGQAKAENAQAKAEIAKGQSDADRTAALALASSAVADSMDSKADAKASQAAAEKSKGQADAANSRAQKAEGEKSILRAQLLMQLNSILQTQDTARGLIVNMSDALFKTGSSELKPLVREKLAKIAGIVSSQPSLKLNVEGHTDSVGGDEYNQQLSEKRALSAMDYLVSQGVNSSSISSQGFGKNSPLESNDTAQGRQKNRRVEIIVSGDAIGTVAMAR
ncbi:MAG: hypothetical protein A2297_08275 [Elusimicrobia bacterium RIFOXYB2_FULL_48_7]|nr:MAG: hypothetical protein A2297_08275 [Elusimicrobia bacterium RIFOXYB2_FULL_48_7]